MWRICLVLLAQHALGDTDRYHRHTRPLDRSIVQSPKNEAELGAEFWRNGAAESIAHRLRNWQNTGVAKNLVLFLGDGMSVPTLFAARTLLGQRHGENGEEAHLSFEKFPTTGIAKTYCVNAQIPDSACTATAYLTGVKTNEGCIGVTANVSRFDCEAASFENNQLSSIAAWALEDGRAAGIVTTTRVTHASPAGAFAHTANRDWESDADLTATCGSAAKQDDIALQLVHGYPGNQFKVILGGGRREFLPQSTIDEEGVAGRRLDGRDLVAEWRMQKAYQNVSYGYVWDGPGLRELEQSPPEYLLGLFESSHMQYNLEANPDEEPSLAELTEIAIKVLSQNEKGFFLFVEGGRIDHAHHDNYIHLALDETIELSKAVEAASNILSPDDSLLVVTSDHAHVMTVNGYSHRGNDILGPSDDVGDDGVPYMTLTYANGPGYVADEDGHRVDPTPADYKSDHYYRAPAAVPLSSESHGGDDVAVFARGPEQHLFSGHYEQHHIPHLMAYSACLGPYKGSCGN